MHLVFFFAACLALTATATAEKKIICYFGSWSVNRQGNGKFDINDTDPSLCTHLIYTFVGIQADDVRVIDAWQELPDNWGKNGFGHFNALRNRNPSVKTMIAIGGWGEGSANYSLMASNSTSRDRFAVNAVKFVKKWGFNGLDLHWMYPAARGGAPEDVQNYIELLKVLRMRLDEEGLIFSAAVGASELIASKSYNISEMGKYLDFISLLSYDFHGIWETQTGINAPLRASPSDNELNKGLTVEAAVNYWLTNGAPRGKLIVGVATYGNAFNLTNPDKNVVGAPIRGAGIAGPYTRAAGIIGYNEICELHKSGGWKLVFDNVRRGSYTFKDNQWISYDNVRSVREKAEYIARLNLGGAMIYGIETDDFKGICGETYPLLKTLDAVLRTGNPVPDELPPPATPMLDTAVKNSDKTVQQSRNRCTRPGNLRDPKSCGIIACIPLANGTFEEYPFECSPGSCHNPTIGKIQADKVDINFFVHNP